MYKQHNETASWRYKCDECGAETTPRAFHDSNNGIADWKVAGYHDLHFCPECRKLPHIQHIIQEAECETDNIMGVKPT